VIHIHQRQYPVYTFGGTGTHQRNLYERRIGKVIETPRKQFLGGISFMANRKAVFFYKHTGERITDAFDS